MYKDDQIKRENNLKTMKEQIKAKKEKIKQLDEISQKQKKAKFERKIKLYKDAYEARNEKIKSYREMAYNKPTKIESPSKFLSTAKTENTTNTEVFEFTQIPKRAMTPNHKLKSSLDITRPKSSMHRVRYKPGTAFTSSKH